MRFGYVFGYRRVSELALNQCSLLRAVCVDCSVGNEKNTVSFGWQFAQGYPRGVASGLRFGESERDRGLSESDGRISFCG